MSTINDTGDNGVVEMVPLVEFHALSPPVLDQEADTSRPPRSIDAYLESVYQEGSDDKIPTPSIMSLLRQRWRYYAIFAALGIANSGDAAEISCAGYLLSSATFQEEILRAGGDGEGEGVDFAGRGAALAGAHIAGMMISGLLSGILADLWGRRSTLLLGLVANGIFGTLSVFVFNARQLCILRFLLGLGLGMVIAGVVPLVAEISPPSNRGRYMTLVSSTFTAGFLFSSIAALTIFRSDGGSGQWRTFLLINTAPTIVAGLLVYFMVPESPRFFLSSGRVEEAVAASNMVAARIRGKSSAGHDDPLTVEELTSHLAQVRSKRFDDDEAGSREKEALVVRGTMSGDGASKESFLWGLWKGLSSISQVFVHGMYRVTVPIQVVYFCLMAVTGEYQQRL